MKTCPTCGGLTEAENIKDDRKLKDWEPLIDIVNHIIVIAWLVLLTVAVTWK